MKRNLDKMISKSFIIYLSAFTILVVTLQLILARFNDVERYHDDVPNMLESMIRNGDVHKYIDNFKMKEMSLIYENRRLESNMVNASLTEVRPCNELIYTLTPSELRQIMTDYIDILLTSSFPFRDALDKWIERKYVYGIKAYKLCASCDEFRSEYGGSGETSSNAFDTYCGDGKYAADVNVSGLLTIPIDEDGEFLENDASPLALWSRWVDYNPLACPSEQFHNDTYWGNNIDDFEERGYVPSNFFTAGIGIVTLLPDYVGFGESLLLDPIPATKRGYQTSAVPLVLKAKDFLVNEFTEGKISLSDKVVISGYSEGGMASVVIGNALHDVGFNVRTQTGGGTFDFTSVNSLFNVFLKSRLGQRIAFVGWAASLSSVNPDLPNTNQGQDFLSSEWRDTVLDWFRFKGDIVETDDIRIILENMTQAEYTALYNQNVRDMVTKAQEAEDVQDVCEVAIEGETDLFCDALKLNEVKKEVAEAKHVTNLCWAADDQMFPKEANIPSLWNRLRNPNLRTVIIPEGINDSGESGYEYSHTVAGGYCHVLFALRFHAGLY